MKDERNSTIFVYQRENDPLRYVRCIEDSNLLCEVKGHVAYVVMGLGLPPRIVKVKQSYIRIKCKRCDTFYHILIQTI